MIEFFYNLVYMLPLSFIATINYMLYSGSEENVKVGCIAGSVFIILILVLRHAGTKERYLISGVLIAAVVSVFWLLGDEKRTELFSRFEWLLVILGLSVVAAIIGRLAESLIWMKALLIIAIVANIIYQLINKSQISSFGLVISIAVILIYLMELTHRNWDRSGYTDVKKHVAFIAPIILICCVLIAKIPTSDKAFEWTFAKNIWKATVTEYKRFVGLFASGKEEYGYMGFGDETAINGKIKVSDKEVMFVTAESGLIDHLYLGGIAYKDFDGHNWDNEDKGNLLSNIGTKADYRLIDMIETRAAVNNDNKMYIREYLMEDTIRVENRRFNTKYVFVPSKVNFDIRKNHMPKYKESEMDIQTNKKMRYGDYYELSFYKMNFANPDLIELIDTAKSISKDEWRFMVNRLDIDSRDKCTYEQYLAYRDDIYEKYNSQAEVSDEVKSLVEEIIVKSEEEARAKELTAGGEVEISGVAADEQDAVLNFGDYEKLKAIARYLQSFDYNTNPGSIPASVNNGSKFLDYFLLESKTGYCVHFASAMTLLAREMGHPARFVQGYYIKRNNKGEDLVTERKSHAWCEVYFDNFGWVTLEATPGYSLPSGWAVQQRLDSDAIAMMYNPDEIHPPELESELPEIIEEEEIIPEEKKEFPINFVLIPLAVAAFFGLMYILIFRIVSEMRFRRMDNDGKIRMLVTRSFRIIKIMGYSLGADETVAEYGARIAGGSEEIDISFLKLYEKLLYSEYVALDADVTQVKEAYEVLKKKLRKKKFRYRFYLL